MKAATDNIEIDASVDIRAKCFAIDEEAMTLDIDNMTLRLNLFGYKNSID